MNQLQKLLFILLLLLASCSEGRDENKTTEPEIPTKPVTEFEKIKITELNGSPIDLRQYKGKTLFINFWATWCKPCIKEMPFIQKAMEELKDEEVVFLFASNESVDDIKTFQQNNSYDFHYVKLENLEALNVMTLPTTYIFNAAGKLVFSEMGYREWNSKSNLDLIRNAGK